MVTIEESGMKFGEYPDEDVFYIEKSAQYRENLMPDRVKSCEFIMLRGEKICFVEAKTSNPREITAESPEEKKEKYKNYIADIAQKMEHSLLLYGNILLNRYDMKGIPGKLLSRDLSEKKLQLILVVKNARKEWLIPLQDKLQLETSIFRRIWKIDRFYVINEATARRQGFVI